MSPQQQREYIKERQELDDALSVEYSKKVQDLMLETLKNVQID